MKIGQFVRQRRKAKGVTLDALAEKTGICKASLSMYETDFKKRGIPLSALEKIAEGLDDLELIAEHCLRCPVRQKIMLPILQKDIRVIKGGSR